MAQPAFAFRTLSCELRKTTAALVSLGLVTAGLGMQAKNIRHSGLFFIRNLYSLFDKDGRRQPGARGDKGAVDEVNAAIRAINQEHQEENLKIAAQNHKIRQANKALRQMNRQAQKACPKGRDFEPIPEMAEIPLKRIYRLFGAKHNPARPKDILDRTLLFRVVHDHLDQDGGNVWVTLPAVVAQQTLIELIEAFRGYFEAMKQYRKAPERFTGRPKWPDYGEKHQPIPITFTGQSLKKKKAGGGVEYRFVAVDDKVGDEQVYLDYDKTAVLLPWALEALEAFPLDETLAKMRAANQLPDTTTLREVRLRPLPDYGVELEAIFKVPMALPAGSLAEDLYGKLDKNLKDSEINDALVKMLRHIPADQLPRIAAIDPGLNNFLAMAYSFKQRGMVLTNRAIEHDLERFDRRYDQCKSALMSPELRALQAKSEAQQLMPDEWVRYKRGIKALHKDEQIRQILRDRGNWQGDMLHKVSAGIIDYLTRYKVQVLVIGLNTFWKHGICRGRKMNRRSYRTAHTKLIELLKYKGLAAGIVVVTTEESYTSKTSFPLDEELQVYDATKELSEAFDTDEEEVSAGAPQPPVSGEGPKQGETPPAAPVKKVVLRGRRGRDAERNFFTSPGAPVGWEVIHADINGALNILRKVFRNFRWHAGLTPKFLLFKFDQTANLSRLQFA